MGKPNFILLRILIIVVFYNLISIDDIMCKQYKKFECPNYIHYWNVRSTILF